jgi:hypothetical protein
VSTPAYQGPNQPIAEVASGWLGRIGSLFASGAPAYAAAPPTLKDTQTDTKVTIAAQAPICCPIDPTCCPIDPAALAAGQIAIVIPRERLRLPETETE